MLLPYLHDRKIYLNRLKINTDYFYTSVETKPEDEELYHDEMTKKLSTLNEKFAASFKRRVTM